MGRGEGGGVSRGGGKGVVGMIVKLHVIDHSWTIIVRRFDQILSALVIPHWKVL